MITVTDLELSFGGDPLFKDVNLKFTPGNCYGVIGANGAGKSTFLRLLSGDLEASKGSIEIPEKERMSVLKQDHFQFDQFSVLDTVIMGNKKLYDIMKQKEALYLKPDFSEEDGILAAELETEFAEMGGWDAESDAGKLLNGLGIQDKYHNEIMGTLNGSIKVKVLLAQALFGNPDILLLDEPTNHMDEKSIAWLEDFLLDYLGTVIVVSHDRHFLNTVCTHTVDVDYGKITMWVGNYDFWYESSQLMLKLTKQQNMQKEKKIEELKAFIRRFGANKSMAKQATSRKKMLEKIQIEEMPASNRKYPYINFKFEKELGKDILEFDRVSFSFDGKKLLDNVSFRVSKDDKIAILGDNENAITSLFQLMTGEILPDEGKINWGKSVNLSYLPKDQAKYFSNDMKIVDWLSQFSKEKDGTFLRGFLGRMLFSGDDANKSVRVLSGGEKVRCMMSKMMVEGGNVLLFDEPTNHLDLESITALNNGMQDFKGVILFSSHDHQLLQTIANRIFEIKDGKLIDRMCDYETFLEKYR
ncbi:MAG: ATP-binding cassette domain-containing protein [Clostridia bacterium]|nr:ATP-binding cassette domain-containing protein [Clostridia bacterium]